jgi:hypothetical protein
MTEKSSENPEKSSMSSVAINWRARIEAIAGDPQGADTRESMIARAARKAGTSYRTTRALYYGETTDPRYSIGRKIDRIAAQQADRYEAIAMSLENQDASFHRITIDQYRSLARRIRGQDVEGASS